MQHFFNLKKHNKAMEFKHFIGIDVSKFKLDAVCHHNGAYLQVDNNKKGYLLLLKWATKQCGVSTGQILFCYEHTGIYSLVLSVFLDEKKVPCVVESPYKIKHSQGLVRGKDDKADARQIARYAYTHREELTFYKVPSPSLIKLKNLLTLRDRLVTQRAGYLASHKDYRDMLNKKENKELFDDLKSIIASLDRLINKVEQQIEQIIEADGKLKESYGLMQSIRGVGRIVSCYMLVHTQGFTCFNTWREFASFCGLAPYKNESGTVKGKTTVHYMANKKVKSLFHLVSMSAVQNNPEMKDYYQRRLEEGKSKMSSLNIVRNKMLARIFAVVKRGTPYTHMNLQKG